MRTVLFRRHARWRRAKRALDALSVLDLCGSGESERDDERHEHWSAGA